MEKIGDYTGTDDDILDRYKYLSELYDTTGYSQKEWKIIYAHSGLVMEVLLARHRGELPAYWEITSEERNKKSKIVSSYRESERSERLRKREQVLEIKKEKEEKIGVLVEVLGKVSQWKIEVEERKGQAAAIVKKTNGGVDELRSFFVDNNDYSSQSTEDIIMWIVHYTTIIKSLPSKAKDYKKLCKEIVRELHIELGNRRIPMNIFEVNRVFIGIPQSRKDTFFNALNATTSGSNPIQQKGYSARH